MSGRRRFPPVIVGVVLLLAGGAWVAWHWWPRGNDKVTYQTAVLKRTDIVNAVTATGTLSAVVSVQVGSQSSGNIKTLYADFNTPVKAGQTVAQLDPATFEAVMHQAEGELANAQAASAWASAPRESSRGSSSGPSPSPPARSYSRSFSAPPSGSSSASTPREKPPLSIPSRRSGMSRSF